VVKNQKLLVIGNSFPHSGHSVRSANIVIFELLRALSRAPQSRVAYMIVRRASDPPATDLELYGLSELSHYGIEVITLLQLPPARRSMRRLISFLYSWRLGFYPESAHSDLVYKKVLGYTPDVLLIPWSEWLTALCADFPIKKFAYYGNPDPKTRKWRLDFDRRHKLSKRLRILDEMTIKMLESVHLKIMKSYNIVGEVAENDALYYRESGHQNAIYIQNVWINRFGNLSKRIDKVGRKVFGPSKIIANVGKLDGTANRYGLEILGRDVAPILRTLMDGVPYELHILGSGNLEPFLRGLLDSEEIKIRGFVDDIDREMLDADIFLCLNNASPFKVCHTRYFHAWSLGMCVVAHSDAALSVPEMRHKDNCLLGHDEISIARLIYEAVTNKALQEQIGSRGYHTFQTHFTAERVAEKIWNLLDTAS